MNTPSLNFGRLPINKLRYLDFSKSYNMERLNLDELRYLPSIEFLDVSECKIRETKGRIKQNWGGKLHTINLNGNRFRYLPLTIFQLNSLEKVFVKYNFLKTVDVKGLHPKRPLVKMKYLYLDGNEITDISDNIFRQMPNLETLSLLDNWIVTIGANFASNVVLSFSPNRSLKELFIEIEDCQDCMSMWTLKRFELAGSLQTEYLGHCQDHMNSVIFDFARNGAPLINDCRWPEGFEENVLVMDDDFYSFEMTSTPVIIGEYSTPRSERNPRLSTPDSDSEVTVGELITIDDIEALLRETSEIERNLEDFGSSGDEIFVENRDFQEIPVLLNEKTNSTKNSINPYKSVINPVGISPTIQVRPKIPTTIPITVSTTFPTSTLSTLPLQHPVSPGPIGKFISSFQQPCYIDDKQRDFSDLLMKEWCNRRCAISSPFYAGIEYLGFCHCANRMVREELLDGNKNFFYVKPPNHFESDCFGMCNSGASGVAFKICPGKLFTTKIPVTTKVLDLTTERTKRVDFEEAIDGFVTDVIKTEDSRPEIVFSTEKTVIKDGFQPKTTTAATTDTQQPIVFNNQNKPPGVWENILNRWRNARPPENAQPPENARPPRPNTTRPTMLQPWTTPANEPKTQPKTQPNPTNKYTTSKYRTSRTRTTSIPTTTTIYTTTTTTTPAPLSSTTPYVPNANIRRNKLSVENAEEEEANRPFFLKTEVLATVAGIIFIFGFTAALFIVHCARKKVREQQQQRDESRSGRRNGRRNGGRRGGIGSSERSSRAAPVQSTDPPGYGTLPGNSGNGGNQGNVNVDALFPADERGGRGLRIPASLQVDLREFLKTKALNFQNTFFFKIYFSICFHPNTVNCTLQKLACRATKTTASRQTTFLTVPNPNNFRHQRRALYMCYQPPQE